MFLYRESLNSELHLNPYMMNTSCFVNDNIIFQRLNMTEVAVTDQSDNEDGWDDIEDLVYQVRDVLHQNLLLDQYSMITTEMMR